MFRRLVPLAAISCCALFSCAAPDDTALICEGKGTISSEVAPPEAIDFHFTVVLNSSWVASGNESAEVSGDINELYWVNPTSTNNELEITEGSYVLTTNNPYSDGRAKSGSFLSIDRRSLRFRYQHTNVAPIFLESNVTGQCRESGKKI